MLQYCLKLLPSNCRFYYFQFWKLKKTLLTCCVCFVMKYMFIKYISKQCWIQPKFPRLFPRTKMYSIKLSWHPSWRSRECSPGWCLDHHSLGATLPKPMDDVQQTSLQESLLKGGATNKKHPTDLDEKLALKPLLSKAFTTIWGSHHWRKRHPSSWPE